MGRLPPVVYLDGVLAHQRRLLEALAQGGGDGALALKCRVSGASVGQHLRHSLSHVRSLLDAATAPHQLPPSVPPPQQSHVLPRQSGCQPDVGSATATVIAYDERSRGTGVELCVATAQGELAALAAALDRLATAADLDRPVTCRFMFAPASDPASDPASGAADPDTAKADGSGVAAAGPGPADSDSLAFSNRATSLFTAERTFEAVSLRSDRSSSQRRLPAKSSDSS